jgi:hypothetical protein
MGGGGGLWWKFEIKTQDRTLSKNNNPGLVFIKKNPGPLCPWIFFFRVNNMKYWHPHLPLGQYISVSPLVLLLELITAYFEQHGNFLWRANKKYIF